MNQAVRPRLSLIIPPRKDVETEPSPHLSRQLSGGSLSPDLTPASPPSFPQSDNQHVLKIDKYLLLGRTDTLQLQSGLTVEVYKARHTESGEDCICKILPICKYREVLSAYWCMGSHENISEIAEIILGETQAYVFFPQHHGDLHSYIRSKRKLKEAEACRLFLQIIAAVLHCHFNGVVLRDLKLRKFVFKDPERTQLKLESLEDACVLDDEDDSLADKHGCPAYVSPEILTTTERYSGKAADMWSLGVILYTMLIGRYPFQDSDAGALFTKIRRGMYNITDTISSRAKCLIRSLLRMNPLDRLTAEDVISHPWFCLVYRPNGIVRTDLSKDKDQLVPSFDDQDHHFEFS